MGGIHRKLAQYDEARADYEHTITIDPFHAEHVAKARRCLEQLDALRRSGREVTVAANTGNDGESPPGSKRRRLSTPSPEKIACDPHVSAGAEGSAKPISAGQVDAAYAHKCLKELGRDCSEAGLTIFGEGHVFEQEGALRMEGRDCGSPFRGARGRR